jgi:hypothetical protein
MKRNVILAVCLTIICLFGWLFFWPDAKVQPNQTTNEREIAASGQHSSGLATQPRTEQLKALISTNDIPVNFYGIVFDTEERPLKNVEVEWDLLKSGSFAPSLGFSARSLGKVRTDANGRFSILNEKGLTISIKSLQYAGYHNLDKAPRSFGYRNAKPYQPDITAPIRFVMIKDGGNRSIKLDIPLKFDWDGQPKEFSIGPKGFPNKIILIPTREPLKSNEREYNWKLVIKAKDAQLILGNNEAAPLAPESGYADSIVLQTDIEGQRGSAADALMYLKTNVGKYAELRFRAYSDRGVENSATGYIDIRWNPDGGRAFE